MWHQPGNSPLSLMTHEIPAFWLPSQVGQLRTIVLDCHARPCITAGYNSLRTDLIGSTTLVLPVLRSTKEGQAVRGMNKKYVYLPENSAESCDVLLLLDDGSDLLAHSHILARESSLFADMLGDGLLSDHAAVRMTALPLTDCSRTTATRFLVALYNNTLSDYIWRRKEQPMLNASVAHQLDMKILLP